MYLPWEVLTRRDVVHTTATVMMLPALSSLLQLVSVTLAAILQVALVCLAGYFLARRGVLDKKTQTKLNKLNVTLLTPALLFSKVAFSLTPERLTELAVVPFGFVIVSLISAACAYAASWMMRIPPGQRNFVIACSITPNSNTLPVALIQSLAGSVPELHWVRNGQDTDTPDDMMGRALTYLVLFSTLGTVQRWSIASSLLSKVTTEAHPNNWLERSGTGFTDDVTDFLIDQQHRDQLANRSQIHEPYRDDPNAPVDDRHVRFAPPREPLVRRCLAACRSAVRAVLDFMTVPLWAALASFVVALIPPLQQMVVSLTSLVGALKQAGACSIPLTILVLGAYFAGDVANTHAHEHPEQAEQSPETPDYSWRTITAATMARMILTPLVMLPMLAYVCLVSRNKVVDDPVFIACAALVIGSPPALTLAQITSQRGDPNSNVEYLISGTIFVSYVILTAPTTIGLVMSALAIDEVQNQFVVQQLRSWVVG
ncbi:hypothetical protein MOBT1_000799 [Malassezia obtusa]|uniref:Auxin efflux carrier n=1 Tax=Malassezia obtusa TaxID=76774 RepID=A0AAF0IR08_9BASI|nr:hypothetical protein MOBT1_000799 [Malassezia obtusa]